MTRSAIMELTFLNDQITWSGKAGQTVMLPLEIHNRGNRAADKLYINIAMPNGSAAIASPPHPQGHGASLIYNDALYNLFSELFSEPVFPGRARNYSITLLNPLGDGQQRRFGWNISTEDGVFPPSDRVMSFLHYTINP